MTSAPARAWLSDCLDQRRDRLIVEDLVAAEKAVVAVARIGVERDVGDEPDLGEFLLDGAAGAADEVLSR